MMAPSAAGPVFASAGSWCKLGRTPTTTAHALTACAALISFASVVPALGGDPNTKAGQQAERRDVKTLAGPPQHLAPPDAGLRTTLLTLNDALRSDNFTVLRDISSTPFRGAYTAGGLSRLFSGLARQGIDLSAVAVLTPTLSEPPAVDAKKGALRLRGQFAGNPVGIEFDLVFAAEAGRWKVLDLSVQPGAARVPSTGAPLASGQK